MSEIGYKSWGLIAVDDELTTTLPTTFNPPMLVNLALDRGASLVLELATAPPPLLHLAIETTAISAGSDPAVSFCILTGLAADALNRCADSPWEIHYDSYYAQIQTTIVNPAPFIKLHYIGALGSVITRINFSTP